MIPNVETTLTPELSTFALNAATNLLQLVTRALDQQDGPNATRAHLADLARGRAFVEAMVNFDGNGISIKGFYCSHGAKSSLFCASDDGGGDAVTNACVNAASINLWGFVLEAFLKEGKSASVASIDEVMAGRASVEVLALFTRRGMSAEGHYCSHGGKSHLFSLNLKSQSPAAGKTLH
jgi:hypothetical protein